MKLFPLSASELQALESETYEPLQFIGHIQPHGAILVLDSIDLRVLQVSQNIQDFLDFSPEAIFQTPLVEVLGTALVERLQKSISVTASGTNTAIPDPLAPVLITLTPDATGNPRKALAILHPVEGCLILELEPVPLEGLGQADQFYTQANRTIARIKRAKTCPEFFQNVATEIRKLIQFDRVMIYRFDHANNGQVLAEDVQQGWEPYLGLHYPAADIPEVARALFMQTLPRLIPQVDYEPVPFVAPDPVTTPLDLATVSVRGVSACHLEYLQNMGVRASLTIPLIDQNTLWGLIACHHTSPKIVEYPLRKLCELLGRLVSLELVLREEQEIEHYRTQIQHIEETFRQDLAEYPNQLERVLQHNQRSLLDLVKAEGAAIALGHRLILLGQTPNRDQVGQVLDWISMQTPQNLLATDCLSESIPEAIEFQQMASGILAISMVVQWRPYRIVWFRPAQSYQVHWGGDPRKSITTDPVGILRLSPRGSFACWQEDVQGRSLPWQSIELEAAKELRCSLLITALEISQAELQETALQAEQASRIKSDFLANMSHEIRTPMNAILGFTQLLETTALDTEQQTYVQSITQGGDHLLSIINDILDLSKLEAGELKLQAREFFVSEIVQEVIQFFQPQAIAKNITLASSIMPDVPDQLQGPVDRVRQVLTNLVGNALKFTDEGVVALRVEQISEVAAPQDGVVTLRFSVRDTGIGIALADQTRIFEAFTQLETSATRYYEGTGLGLTISRKIVHLMGGTMGVESTPKRGSTFWFSVPLEQPALPLSDLTHPAPQLPLLVSTNPCPRILIVEDATQNQILLLSMLSRLGYEAQAVNNGQEALDYLSKGSYNLVLMDCQMPVLNGYDATKMLRQHEGGQQHTTVVGVTAYAMTGDREKCLAAGMDDYISKPFRLKDLVSILERWI